MFNKAEVCQGGVRITGLKGTTELPWDQIDLFEVGTYLLNGEQRWGVTIYDVAGNQTDLLKEFWDSAGGTTRFMAVAKQITTVERV